MDHFADWCGLLALAPPNRPPAPVQLAQATLIENIATIGSFAHGSSEQAAAVCAEPVVNQLLQRLAHDDPAIVEPCARAVRTLIHTGNVALESLIVGPELIGKLVLHLSMYRLTSAGI